MEKSLTKNSVEIIKGDCLKGLTKLKDESINLTVTSPPYNIKLKSRNDYTVNYFDNTEESIYRKNIGKLMHELCRVTKNDGSIWINLKNRWMDDGGNVTTFLDGSLEPPWWLLEYTRGNLFLKNLIIWNYDIGSDTRGNKFSPRYEYFFWFTKHVKNYKFNIDDVRTKPRTNDKRNNPNGANPTDVWYFPIVKGNSRERNDHPAQFPEELVERIILSCSNKKDTVLDPFLGSGTTLTVALLKERNGIGFERPLKLSKDR